MTDEAILELQQELAEMRASRERYREAPDYPVGDDWREKRREHVRIHDKHIAHAESILERAGVTPDAA